MSPRTRVTGSLALVLTAAVVVTGCSRSDDTGSAAAGEVTDGPATGDLTVWADSVDAEPLAALVSAFEEENPDVTVDLVNVPYDDYTTRLSTAISGGTVPDMAFIGSQSLPGMFATGAFESVPDDLIDESSFYAGALEAVQYDDTTYGVPISVETRPFLYRSDLAEAAGVEAPTTWDDYVPFAKALESAGAKKGMRIETGEEGSTSIIMSGMIWQAGGEMLSEDGSEWTFDTPEVVEAFETYGSFFEEDIAPNPGPEWGTIDAGFVNGDFGSYITGAWSFGFADEIGGEGWSEENIGVSVLPEGPGGNSASLLDGKAAAVFADGENTDAAWKFAQFMADVDTQGMWFEESGVLPAVEAAMDLPAIADEPLLAAFSDQLAEARPAPAVTTWSEVATEIQAAAERVSSGSMSAADSVAELQSRADSIGVGE
jgi:multiple sugar transport system substrate-binding protein